MVQILTVGNDKGGVGKTTISVNLIAALARGVGEIPPQRVLGVDMDSSGNLSLAYLGEEPIKYAYINDPDDVTIYEVLMGKNPPLEGIRTVKLEANRSRNLPATTFDLLPAHGRLKFARTELMSDKIVRREDRLTRALKQIETNYDFIVIDSGPTMDILTMNSLMAATQDPNGVSVIAPTDPGELGINGIIELTTQLDDIAETRAIEGLYTPPTGQARGEDFLSAVVINKYQKGRIQSDESLGYLQEAYGVGFEYSKDGKSRTYKGGKTLSPIPDREAFKKSTSEREDIFKFDIDNTSIDAAQAFTRFAEEVYFLAK